MDTTELLKKVRHIEIKTKGLTNQIFAGEYHSAFKGMGMSFSEVRAYQFGDDIRNIDWNVTARSNDPHIKVFEEERELTVVLMIDVSGSSKFGTKQNFKSDLATELAAVIAFSAIKNNDKIGVIFFSDEIEKYIPPAKGKKHILRIIRELLVIEPKGNGSDVSVALQFLNNVVKKRSTVFVLSDFETPSFELALNISTKKHDIIGFKINDVVERDLPNVGLVKMKDPESGQEAIIDTSSKKVRTHLANYFDRHEAEVFKQFKKRGADVIRIMTDESYVKALMKFFKQRARN